MSRVRFQSKENGRTMLVGSWIKAVIILVLTTLMIVGISSLEEGYRAAFGIPRYLTTNTLNLSPQSFIITGISTLLCLLFLPPLFIGQTEWYWYLSEGKKPGIGDVFGWFGSLRHYIKSVWFCLNLFIRVLLWVLLICALPAIMLFYGYNLFSTKLYDLNSLIGALLLFFGTIIMFGALFLLFYILMRYFLALYLLVEDNQRKVGKCFKEAVRLSKGYRWELYKFVLSFSLWFLTCYFVFPIVYVFPYFNTSSTVFVKHVMYSQRFKDKLNKGDTMEFKKV